MHYGGHDIFLFLDLISLCYKIISSILIIKPTRCTNYSFIFGIELYMFRTGFLSIIRSLALYTQQYEYVLRVLVRLLANKISSILIPLASSPVQTGPGAHPASCTMGAGSFPGVKCGRGVVLATHPFLVPRSWKSRAIPLPNLWATPGL